MAFYEPKRPPVLYRVVRGVLAGAALTFLILAAGWHVLALRISHVDRANLTAYLKTLGTPNHANGSDQ